MYFLYSVECFSMRSSSSISIPSKTSPWKYAFEYSTNISGASPAAKSVLSFVFISFCGIATQVMSRPVCSAMYFVHLLFSAVPSDDATSGAIIATEMEFFDAELFLQPTSESEPITIAIKHKIEINLFIFSTPPKFLILYDKLNLSTNLTSRIISPLPRRP